MIEKADGSTVQESCMSCANSRAVVAPTLCSTTGKAGECEAPQTGDGGKVDCNIRNTHTQGDDATGEVGAMFEMHSNPPTTTTGGGPQTAQTAQTATVAVGLDNDCTTAADASAVAMVLKGPAISIGAQDTGGVVGNSDQHTAPETLEGVATEDAAPPTRVPGDFANTFGDCRRALHESLRKSPETSGGEDVGGESRTPVAEITAEVFAKEKVATVQQGGGSLQTAPEDSKKWKWGGGVDHGGRAVVESCSVELTKIAEDGGVELAEETGEKKQE
uniref:Heat shock 70 kDa protein F, mitochondrial n=1 Tax=Lygus hesperus TaxID=30085 RepID=A0A0A9WKS0_LYGHE